MANNRVPTLLIGLGGIGSSIVDLVGQRIAKEQEKLLQNVGLVALDTNLNDLNKIEVAKKIWIGREGLVKSILNKYPEYMAWFPSNRWVNNRGVKDGAGQIRAIARLSLAATGRDDKNALRVINQEIDRIMKNDGETMISQFNVFIAGSITGGTGAGTFLQIPYYVREYLKKRYSIEKVMIRGMFVGADITEMVNDVSRINKEQVKINAYTCMKELNAFYLTQIEEDRSNHLQLEYYERKDRYAAFDEGAEKLMSLHFHETMTEEEFSERVAELVEDGANIPYDSFYLAEGTYSEGGIGNTSLYTVKLQLSKTIYTLLFTPVRAAAVGVEDNFVLLDMLCSGMNRYSAAGLCTLRYPYEQMKEYIALSFCNKLVSEEWLLLDDSCEEERTDAFNQQKTNPKVEIPDIKDMYTRYFIKETSGKEGTKLGHLKKEAFKISDTVAGKDECKTIQFLRDIDAQLDSLTQTDEIENAKADCEVDENKMKKSVGSAKTEINNILENIELFTKIMQNTVERYQYEVANEVFPTNYDSMYRHKDSPLNVFKLLGKVHPIAGRYLCYKMVIELEKKLEKAKKEVVTISRLNEFKTKDYDSEKEDVQSLEEAIVGYWGKTKFIIFSNDKEAGNDGYDYLKKEAGKQVKLIEQFGSTQIRLITYQTLVRRFKVLAEYYGLFFKSIEANIKENEQNIINLEQSYTEDPYGERIVYGSKAAFQANFEEFSRAAEFQLQEDTSEAVFTGIYKQACIWLGSESSYSTSEESKKQLEKRIYSNISSIFQDSVMKEMRDYAEKKGQFCFDLSIKDALAKEMGLVTGLSPMEEEEYESGRIAYTKKKIDVAMHAAAPMLAVTTGAENISENVYLAMNTESAEFEGGKASLSATADKLASEGTEGTDYIKPCVIIDDGFSKYEMICLKVRHKYLAEHLAKYAPGSEFEELYNERIRNLGGEPTDSDLDAYKTVVTPHLNRYWHQFGVVPALTYSERRRDKDNVLKAFVYSMGMDLFVREKHDGLKEEKWTFITRKRNHKLVTDNSAIISSTYAELYYALQNNIHMVYDILDRAEKDIEDRKKNIGILVPKDLINTIDFIRDLIQESPEDDDMNYIDILEKMAREEYMDPNAWGELFRGLMITLKDCLWKMFNGNKSIVNEVYQEAITKLYACSNCGKKKAEAEEKELEWTPDMIERKIDENIEELLKVRIFY